MVFENYSTLLSLYEETAAEVHVTAVDNQQSLFGQVTRNWIVACTHFVAVRSRALCWLSCTSENKN
jgi:hypothetical protein